MAVLRLRGERQPIERNLLFPLLSAEEKQRRPAFSAG
jgi:hypothetical protein